MPETHMLHPQMNWFAEPQPRPSTRRRTKAMRDCSFSTSDESGDAHAHVANCREPVARAHAHLVTMRPSRSEFGVRKWEEVADREVAGREAFT